MPLEATVFSEANDEHDSKIKSMDGGITVPGQYGTRIGDSIVVTSDGF